MMQNTKAGEHVQLNLEILIVVIGFLPLKNINPIQVIFSSKESVQYEKLADDIAEIAGFDKDEDKQEIVAV